MSLDMGWSCGCGAADRLAPLAAGSP